MLQLGIRTGLHLDLEKESDGEHEVEEAFPGHAGDGEGGKKARK